MLLPRWRLILNGKSAEDEPLREAAAAMRGRVRMRLPAGCVLLSAAR